MSKEGHKTTGKPHRGISHVKSVPGHDGFADPKHHAMNKQHGGALNPDEEYEEGPESENEECD